VDLKLRSSVGLAVIVSSFAFHARSIAAFLLPRAGVLAGVLGEVTVIAFWCGVSIMLSSPQRHEGSNS
jgi:hypothetical protein